MKKQPSLGLKSGRPSAKRALATTASRLSPSDELKRVNFQVTAEEHRRLKVYAAEHGKTITVLLKQYLLQLINE